MWELETSELDTSEKKLNIDGHLVSTLEAVVVLKELILTVSTLGRCGCPEVTDF